MVPTRYCRQEDWLETLRADRFTDQLGLTTGIDQDLSPLKFEFKLLHMHHTNVMIISYVA